MGTAPEIMAGDPLSLDQFSGILNTGDTRTGEGLIFTHRINNNKIK